MVDDGEGENVSPRQRRPLPASPATLDRDDWAAPFPETIPCRKQRGDSLHAHAGRVLSAVKQALQQQHTPGGPVLTTLLPYLGRLERAVAAQAAAAAEVAAVPGEAIEHPKNVDLRAEIAAHANTVLLARARIAQWRALEAAEVAAGEGADGVASPQREEDPLLETEEKLALSGKPRDVASALALPSEEERGEAVRGVWRGVAERSIAQLVRVRNETRRLRTAVGESKRARVRAVAAYRARAMVAGDDFAGAGSVLAAAAADDDL